MRKITNLVTNSGGMSVFSLGRQTDYAARIVLHLSCLEPGARVTAAQIAEMRLIPAAFIKRIVSRLSAVGIVATMRGSKGGLALARKASEISLLEVVEAFEGPLSLNACVPEPGGVPPLGDVPRAALLGGRCGKPVGLLEGRQVRRPRGQTREGWAGARVARRPTVRADRRGFVT